MLLFTYFITGDSVGMLASSIFLHISCCFGRYSVFSADCCVIFVRRSVVFMLQLSSIHSAYSDSGLFGVHAVASPQNIGKVSDFCFYKMWSVYERGTE